MSKWSFKIGIDYSNCIESTFRYECTYRSQELHAKTGNECVDKVQDLHANQVGINMHH